MEEGIWEDTKEGFSGVVLVREGGGAERASPALPLQDPSGHPVASSVAGPCQRGSSEEEEDENEQ